MGWVGDTLKALFGLDDEQRTFRKSLASAERCLDWRRTEADPRDAQKALQLLAACAPEDAPNAHHAYRRARTEAEAHLFLARNALNGLKKRSEGIRDQFEKLEDGRRSLNSQIESLKGRVSSLEAEGSLISAREERRRLDELEREAREYPDTGAEATSARSEALSALTPSFDRHRRGAAASLELLRTLVGLGADDRQILEQFCSQAERQLGELDEGWKGRVAELESALPPTPDG
ncbi:MAG: hypothetical protein ACYTGB_17250 [Planctomycetota bacterium]|jgi:chromosome segregation ATPase